MTELPDRMSAPALEFRAPLCPLCRNDALKTPAGYACDPCVAFWPKNEGMYGEVESDLGQCTAESQPFAHRQVQFPGLAHRRYRCVRSAGHARKNTGKTEWHVGVLLTDDGPDPDNTWEWEVVRD